MDDGNDGKDGGGDAKLVIDYNDEDKWDDIDIANDV